MHPASIALDASRRVYIDYKNYKGEDKSYRIIPHTLWFGKTVHHPRPEQWFIRATDVDRNVMRDFAFADIKSWRPIS